MVPGREQQEPRQTDRQTGWHEKDGLRRGSHGRERDDLEATVSF